MWRRSQTLRNLACTLMQPVAAYDASAAADQQTVLEALRQVADTLRALQADALTLQARAAAAAQASASYGIARQSYDLGGIGQFSFLDAQRQQLQTSVDRTGAQAQRLCRHRGTFASARWGLVSHRFTATPFKSTILYSVTLSNIPPETIMLNLLGIRSLLETRRPGHTLPQGFYIDPDVFEFDLAAIYGRSWIMAGFEVELPKPGSYLAISIGRSPVVIVRDRSGVLRAFHNTCRHRGAQICATGTGHESRLVCPYHGWTYNLDGTLFHNTQMPQDFARSQHGLRPIHLETIAGTLYVCLADEPPPFSPFREHFEPLLAPHDLTNAKVAFEGVLVEQANWKLVMENARECYHCAAKHPELAKPYPVRRSKTVFEGGAITKAFEVRMAALGLGVGPVEGDWWQASRYPLNEGIVSLTMDGLPSVGKTLGRVGDGNVGTLRWALEPHSFCHALGDYVFMFSAMPTGPQETVVTSKWLVSKDAVPGVDFNVDRLTELWTKTNDQDRALAENNQRGVCSLGYTPGPYSPEAESLVLRFTDWYCAKARSFIEANA